MYIVRKRRSYVSASLGSALVALLGTSAARADFKVKQPDAEYGELEVETVGSYGQSGNPATNNEQSFVHEIEYGFTNFWKSGIEFETGRDPGPGNPLKFNQLMGKLVGVRRARSNIGSILLFSLSTAMRQSQRHRTR